MDLEPKGLTAKAYEWTFDPTEQAAFERILVNASMDDNMHPATKRFVDGCIKSIRNVRAITGE